MTHLLPLPGHVPHASPLIEAVAINRPNRFILEAEVNGQQVRCHCPVSGRIGGLTLDGLPVLISGPYTGRGTDYTVEAVGLEYDQASPTFQWIGINQGGCNRVVEKLLKDRTLISAFPVGNPTEVRREKKLATSRIDFLVREKTFLEVKMPLLDIHAHRDPAVPKKDFAPGNPSERLPKQLKAMTDAIASGYRGAMLVCFQYQNNSGTSLEEQLHSNIFPDADMRAAKAAGLEQWVCELEFTRQDIRFKNLTEIPA